MNQKNHQLVLFLDLWGFKKLYAFVARQKEPTNQETVFLILSHLYQKYIDRLHAKLAETPQRLIKGAKTSQKESEAITKIVESMQVSAISDSIIVTLDCTEETLSPAYWIMSFMLLMVTDEVVKLDFMEENIKKLGFLIFMPVRGGIGYGLSLTSLNRNPSYIFSSAYNDAYKLESKQAHWPRVAISDFIAEQVSKTYLGSISISKDESGPAYFDPLKFKYYFFGKNEKVVFRRKEDRVSLIEKFARNYKNYIELNSKEAALLFKNDESRCHSSKDFHIKPENYAKWISYYNNRITWLTKNDSDFSGHVDLLIRSDFHSQLFGEVRPELQKGTLI